MAPTSSDIPADATAWQRRIALGKAWVVRARSSADRQRIRDCWPLWALDHQLPPQGPWRTWLLLGGRGGGKTRAGAEWVRSLTRHPLRIALIGPTLHDVREVMVEGPSGLRTIAPMGQRPVYEPSRRRLVYGSGAMAYAFSAEDPERLRGPQFHAAWADEFCAWRNGAATLALLRAGLRLGSDPRLVITTTPKPSPTLRQLITEPDLVRTQGPSAANRLNLSPAFLASLQSLYGGSRWAAQELEGQIVESLDAALWQAADLAACRGPRPPCLERSLVAVDPPAGSNGAACGIIVAGRWESRGYVLGDYTAQGLSPLGWAQRVLRAAQDHQVDEIIAEANQGGEMIRSLLAQAMAQLEGPGWRVRLLHASTAKRRRAEPVAALYEQGRIVHTRTFPALEEEMLALGSVQSSATRLDRADALVWALTDLMLTGRSDPRIRRL